MTAPDLAAGRDVLAWSYNAVFRERERGSIIAWRAQIQGWATQVTFPVFFRVFCPREKAISKPSLGLS